MAQSFYPAADEDCPTPTLTVLAEFMQAEGFLSVPDSYYGWVRLGDGVIVTDAKPDNFVLTADGITPIDLQISQVDPVILRELVPS